MDDQALMPEKLSLLGRVLDGLGDYTSLIARLLAVPGARLASSRSPNNRDRPTCSSRLKFLSPMSKLTSRITSILFCIAPLGVPHATEGRGFVEYPTFEEVMRRSSARPVTSGCWSQTRSSPWSAPRQSPSSCFAPCSASPRQNGLCYDRARQCGRAAGCSAHA